MVGRLNMPKPSRITNRRELPSSMTARARSSLPKRLGGSGFEYGLRIKLSIARSGSLTHRGAFADPLASSHSSHTNKHKAETDNRVPPNDEHQMITAPPP